MAWLRWLGELVLILPVRAYQICLRPVLPAVCRFTPSCSEYFILSVRKHGPLRGLWSGIRLRRRWRGFSDNRRLGRGLGCRDLLRGFTGLRLRDRLRLP